MYKSKYYTCEEIDERLLKSYYDDAVSSGYQGTFDQFKLALASQDAVNLDILNNYIDKCNKEYEKSNTIPLPPEAPPLRTISETFFQGEHYITTAKYCRICGEYIRSSSATQEVCDKCAAEYKF